MFKPLRIAVLLAAGALLATSAWAQPAPDDPDAQASQSAPADPPTRVARLSYLRGDVSFVPAGENDWVEAQLNRPLITGDKLWTDHGSRAELNIGQATLRIDQNTSFDFLNLDDRNAQVELTQGSLNLHVRRLYDEQTYEIDTPTLAFVINRVGDFRIDVLPNGQATVVTVQQGAGDAYGEGGARFRIEEGQSVTFNDPQLRDYETSGIPRPDDFDDFCQQRDHRWDSSGSRRYVSEEVIGYEDLDDNGEWTEAPEYGAVWYPTTVSVGWAPYHHGHWGWVGAYGWTWIDDAPWGFAPFHYGRWAFIGGRWGWCPGPVHVRAVYAPALVAFVGGGVGVSVGFGGGPVGWFPLGPRDVYFPSYHVSERYFTSINVSNTRVINNVTINNYYGGYHSGTINYANINYTNRTVNGAITAVPQEAFVGARPVAAAAIAVNQQTFANARVSGFAAVAPTRASLVATTNVARAAPPQAVVARPIVAATKPPAPVLPFAQRQAVLQQNPGRPLAVTQLHAQTPTAAAAGNAAAAGHPNVKVVTSGTPVRTAAPVLPASRQTVGGNAPNANAAANANARATGNVGGAATLNRAGPQTPANRNLPAVQNQQNVQTTGAQNNAATATGRPAAGQHLDSSRFAHPQGGAAGTANPATATGQAPNRVTGGAQTLERSNAGSATGIKNTAGEHAPVTTAAPHNVGPATGKAPTATNPNVERLDRGSGNNNAGNNAAGNAYNRNQGQGRPEYKTPTPQQQPQYHTQEQVHTQQQPQYHTQEQVHTQQQPQYRVQEQPHVQQQQQQPQYRVQEQPHVQQQQQQPQYRVQQQQQQQPQQQQYHTQMQQQMQPQTQQHQSPPPPQHVQPAQQVNRPQPQKEGGNKKDDDKQHH